ncbi:TlpA family protein disulfide reductase [Candidatus Pelagibacter sp.]|mgnify:FL=1|jgi:thiol-disulfide isomerase/thioredoxin|nr:TlpA family protein disulfide reductase [Candidatus Pelagibacter sp.]|tara:strand:- start:508 stop:1020 length:513 start_codon:yes stop_codon:yes gene_type:complete
MKFLIIFLYLITTGLSYSIEPPDLKNIVINKYPKSYENITFKDINNKSVNLENFRNNLVILNFWATWCVPCLEEMPSLDLLQSKNINNLKIFPINIGQEDLLKLKIFFRELKIKNLNIYMDAKINLPKKFLIRGIPTTILINKEGKEFARIVGSIDFSDEKFISWLKNFN